MEETMHDAKQELKRVDHLIYVSLKYTRTVDVLKNVIERLVNAFDYLMIALLKDAKENKKIDEIAAAPIKRCEQTEAVYSNDETIKKLSVFYAFLRKINKLDYGKENEYRRHVAMLFSLDDVTLVVDIDKVTEYYKEAKEYVAYIEQNFTIQND